MKQVEIKITPRTSQWNLRNAIVQTLESLKAAVDELQEEVTKLLPAEDGPATVETIEEAAQAAKPAEQTKKSASKKATAKKAPAQKRTPAKEK